MTMKLNLTVMQPTLLFQQDTGCIVKLENVGSAPLEVDLPPFDPTLPIVHVVSIQTGAEDEYRRRESPQAIRVGPTSMVAGASEDIEFGLLEVVRQLAPGYYDIRVAWEYNGGAQRAVSQFVRVKVLPTTPKSLELVEAVGGRGGYKFGAWVNLSGNPNEPSRIVRSSFALMAGGGIKDVLTITECSLSSRPVLSAPASGTALRNHWIAWIDGRRLNYTHVDEQLGVLRCQHMKLPENGVEIVAPLYSDMVLDTTVRPEGSALLYQSAPDGSHFRLQTLQLTSKKAAPRGEATFAGLKPLWIISHVRSAEQRLVTYLQAEGTQLALHLAPWPGIRSNLVRPTRLADWTGSFVAAGATLGEDNSIRGGVLMWKMFEDAPRRLVLISWRVSGENVVDRQEEQTIDWHPNDPVREARIGVSDSGTTTALIADAEGKWQVFDGQGNLQPVPPEFEKSKQPMELAFMGGVGEPILICGTIRNGFKIIQLDGSLIPSRMTI